MGGHALAIDVTGATLRRQTGMVTFGGYLESLRESTIEELEIAGRMSDVLPTGHEPSIVKTLLRSIRKLGDEGADFLRLTSTVSVAPSPPSSCWTCSARRTAWMSRRLGATPRLPWVRSRGGRSPACRARKVSGGCTPWSRRP